MARKITSRLFPHYVQAYDPDFEKLAWMVSRAKGARTGAEFAKECNLSTATLSKILNQKLTTPLSDEMIDGIARNSIPDNNITLEALLEANGMVPNEDSDNYDRNILKVMHSLPRPEYSSRFVRRARTVIEKRLRQLGIRFSESDRKNFEHTDPLMPGVEYNIENFEQFGIRNWCFDFVFLTSEDNTKSFYEKLKHSFATILVSSIYMQNGAYTIVTNKSDLFESVYLSLAASYLSTAVSLVCVDVVNEVVEEEKQLISQYDLLKIDILKEKEGQKEK